MKNEIIKDRIVKQLCPICGKEPQGNMLVEDAKYGTIMICNTHIVKGVQKLEA